ncbi:MAG TPA: hypothetical protein VKF59_12675 [Candidatus Dormibacteraeota bacterium]|nr:hypothetical protein [Candidatus Dormibacteraeota bacterium]
MHPAWRRSALRAMSLALVLAAACTTQPAARRPSPAASARGAAVTPSPLPQPCAPAQADARAGGVASGLPVLQLATGLTQPDDVLADGDQVLVGELGPGRIARVGGDGPVGGVDRLPVQIPLVEGMARVGGTLYAADQADDRVVAVRDTQVTTLIQLQPVRGLEGVDGIAAAGGALIVPDSPRGAVLFVGPDGQVQRRVAGFARPTGAWSLPDGAVVVADENAGAVVRLAPDGSRQTLVSGLPLADDVVAGADGRIFAISISQGRVVQVVNGGAVDVASGLRSPQGLGIDQAGNLLVTEYDIGRLDAIVTAFALQPAVPAGPVLAPGQPLCVRLVRAPGFQDGIEIEAGPGYSVVQQPGTGSEGSILPTGCSGQCRVRVAVRSGDRVQPLWLAYQR